MMLQDYMLHHILTVWCEI